MAISKVVTSLVAIGMFGAAIAQEETRVKIEVIADDASHEAVRIDLDSNDMGFNLHDMQEGENQAIVDEQGRTILVTRHADGFTFDVEGKSIRMPMISDVHVTHDAIEIDGDSDEVHAIKIVKKVEVVTD